MLFGIMDLGVALILFAAALAVVSLVLDVTDPEPQTAPRPWWQRWAWWR
jgi:hypothetical protein